MQHRKSYSLPAFPSSSSSALPSPTCSLEYIELLGRSNFSFLQGGSHPEEMVLRAKELGYCGFAMCDTNGMYGVVRGFQAAERPSAFDTEQLAHVNTDGTAKHPFHYICGTELTPYNSSPVVLLPMNKEGYTRLCHLITRAKRRAPKGQIVLSLKEIAENNEDLIALPLPPWKEDDLKLLQKAFQDRIYLPVHKDLTWESTRAFHQALKFEQSLGIPAFATLRPLYHAPERKPLHDVLTCIMHKTTLDEAATRLTLNRERYLKPREQLVAMFRDRPDMLARTMEIASRIHFSLTELKYKYPREHLPNGKTANEHLRELVEKGLHWRYGAKTPEEIQKARRLIDHEMILIGEKEYEDYFLTLHDLCAFALKRGILHQGRGSAANSIVCYVLGLTNVDPSGMGLLFERFLSRERNEPPDIDIDFEHDRREEVLQYIYRKYGERHAAMVCTVICYRGRMSIREISKVFGVPLESIDGMIKFMGREGLSNFIREHVDVLRFNLTKERFDQILKLALELRGFPRHLGIHTGGFVISHEPVIDIVPVESATMDNRFVIQWNKDDIDTLKMMKVDVLGLGMLSALRRSLDLLRAHKGIDWNLAQFPEDDVPTYDMICKADTVGVFQIESRAQMSLLPRLRPRRYYDLVVEVAIVRPGPIQGGMVHPYLRRRSGQEKITYAHPKLEPILKRTFGIPLFQEQVMQIVSAVAGFTPGESDELRRVMSNAWRKQTLMEGLRHRVISGMLNNKIPLAYAEQIYKTIEGFASYGFPESHAASFALITYISCYLKKHYPDVFTCALLNSQPMGFYTPRQLVADAQRHGVTFLPLDVNTSLWDYDLFKPGGAPALPLRPSDALTARLQAVRTGFRSVHSLREEHVQKLVEERNKRGAFKDLSDLVKRTELPKVAMIRLAGAGAFEIFGLNAREALWNIQSMTFDVQSLMFGEHAGLDPDRLRTEADDLPQENAWDEIRREYATKGFSIENHPIRILRPHFESPRKPFTRAEQLPLLKHRTRLRIAGLVSLMQKPPTAGGVCFLSLEDETGLMNIVVMPDIYLKYRLMLMTTPMMEVNGFLESVEGVYNIRAQTFAPLLASDAQKNLPGNTSALDLY